MTLSHWLLQNPHIFEYILSLWSLFKRSHLYFREFYLRLQVFPIELYDMLEECLPFYNALKRNALRLPSFKSSIPVLPVPKNEKILVWVGDQIVPREDAKVWALNRELY